MASSSLLKDFFRWYLGQAEKCNSTNDTRFGGEQPATIITRKIIVFYVRDYSHSDDGLIYPAMAPSN